MREYLLVFITAFAVTYLLAVLARELAMRFGAFAKVRDRDVHEVPIPYFGGVAMLAGLGAAILRRLASCRSSATRRGGHIFHDARAILLGGAVHLPGRRHRRHLRAGCDHQARRPGAGGRRRGHPGGPAALAAAARRRLGLHVHARRVAVGAADGHHHRHHGERGELRRRAGRAGRRASSGSARSRSSRSPCC